MEAEACCPYCGEWITFWIDLGGGSVQHYIEDCSICCRPIEVFASVGEDTVEVDVRRADA